MQFPPWVPVPSDLGSHRHNRDARGASDALTASGTRPPSFSAPWTPSPGGDSTDPRNTCPCTENRAASSHASLATSPREPARWGLGALPGRGRAREGLERAPQDGPQDGEPGDTARPPFLPVAGAVPRRAQVLGARILGRSGRDPPPTSGAWERVRRVRGGREGHNNIRQGGFPDTRPAETT